MLLINATTIMVAFISVAFDCWAFYATAAALRRSRRISDVNIAQLRQSLSLLAKDWAKERRVGGGPRTAR